MKISVRFCNICISFCIVFLSGCSMNLGPMVSNRLDREVMNNKLETKTIDLSDGSKCSDVKNVRLINGESRTDEYCINYSMGGCRFYVTPKDFAYEIISYLDKMLNASNIKVGSGSDIIVSIEDLKSQEGVWSFGSSCKIQIQIPEINYTQTYIGESGSGLGDLAAAYAIHLAVDNFFKDPVFQRYVKCQM